MKRNKNRPPSFTRRGLLRKIALFFAFFLFFVAIGTGLWFFRNGEFMKVVDFKVSGTIMVPQREVLSLIKGEDGRRGGLWGFLLPENHWFAYLDDASLAEFVKERFPRIKEISILRDYAARSMSIYVSERQGKIIWCSAPALPAEPEEPLDDKQNMLTDDKKCFWLDNEGLVIGESPDSRGTLVAVIVDRSGRALSPGKMAIPQEKLQNLIGAAKMINSFRWTAEEIVIKNPLLKDAVVTASAGQNILISLERFPQEEEKLILDTIVAEGKWPQVEYIDLRVEGKGFYKLR